MTRTKRNQAKHRRNSNKFKNKLDATALIIGGILTGMITDDATALVLLMLFATPLFFTDRRVYTK